MFPITEGSLYPDKRYQGSEGLVITASEVWFSLLIFQSNMEKEALNELQSFKFRYGLYEQDNIPFLLISATEGKTTWSAPFNVRKMPPWNIKPWIDAKIMAMSPIIIVDASQYQVQAFSAINFEPEFVDKWKASCQKQYESYETVREIESQTNQILAAVSKEEMFEKAMMLDPYGFE